MKTRANLLLFFLLLPFLSGIFTIEQVLDSPSFEKNALIDTKVIIYEKTVLKFQ